MVFRIPRNKINKSLTKERKVECIVLALENPPILHFTDGIDPRTVLNLKLTHRIPATAQYY